MSLLNQVLQDLQERQSPDLDAAPAALRDIRMLARGAPVPRRPWVLWIAIVMLAGVSGKLLWQRGQQDKLSHAVTYAIPVLAGSAPRVPAPAAVARPVQQPAVAPRAPAIAPPAIVATVPAAPHLPPPATASGTAAADHAGTALPAASPTATPRVSAPVPETFAPQARTTAAAAARTTASVAAQNATAIAAMPAAAPSIPAVEKTARPLNPEQQAELTYQDALHLLQSGRPSAAEPRLRAALDTYPAHRAARTALAGLLINGDRLPEATSVLAAGLALSPDCAPFAKLYARLRIDQGELGDARAVLERAAPTAQDDPDYHALLAALYQRLGLYEQAAQTYRAALQAQPRNGVWWLGLGLALEGGGDRASALQAYQRAQQSGTLDSEVLHYVESRIEALR